MKRTVRNLIRQHILVIIDLTMLNYRNSKVVVEKRECLTLIAHLMRALHYLAHDIDGIKEWFLFVFPDRADEVRHLRKRVTFTDLMQDIENWQENEHLRGRIQASAYLEIALELRKRYH